MIDAFAILASCAMLAFIAIRAVKFDSRLPWFEPIGPVTPRATEVAASPQTAPRQVGILSAPPADPGRGKGRS